MSSFIDIIIVHSVLSGGLLLPFLFVLWWFHNYLWQEALWVDCFAALQYAQEDGFVFRKRGLRARWTMVKKTETNHIRIIWKGGPFGSRCLIRSGKQVIRCGKLQTVDQFTAALSHLEPTSKPQHS